MSSRNSVATWADSVVRVDREWKGSLPWLGRLKRPDEVGCAHEKAPPGFAESGEDLQQYVGDPLECRWRPTDTLCLLHAAEALAQVAREHPPGSPIPGSSAKVWQARTAPFASPALVASRCTARTARSYWHQVSTSDIPDTVSTFDAEISPQRCSMPSRSSE
jgi:hypothetical protein